MTNISGTYKLTRYGYHYKKSNEFKPISEGYSGIIHYDPNGFMSVTLRFETNPEEFGDIVAYCGKYRVVENKIIHNVTMSVRPEYEGQELVREFKLEGKNLETEFENTEEFRKFAIWEKQ